MKTGSYEVNDNKFKLIKNRIDQNRIRHKKRKEIEVYTDIVSKIDLSMFEKHVRSGIIVYTHYKGKTYFCLGNDSIYGDLTDFGGGVKKEENVIEGGLRELKEESQGVFGELKYENIKNSIAFYTTNMIIMFIKLNVNMKEVKNNFLYKLREKYGPDPKPEMMEVSNIFWIDTEDLLKSIEGQGLRMYIRVRKILDKVKPYISPL